MNSEGAVAKVEKEPTVATALSLYKKEKQDLKNLPFIVLSNDARVKSPSINSLLCNFYNS